MSRIQGRFEALKKSGRKALIPYLTAGDPQPSLTVPLMRALVEAGSDILELGVPFSDPMADGPVIQRSSERALKHGIGLGDVLGMARDFRSVDRETPLALMGYANPIEAMGIERFLREAKGAGIDGVIVVDYPPEECVDFARRKAISIRSSSSRPRPPKNACKKSRAAAAATSTTYRFAA
jgi:tryptophan synthase alpha chain